jgi:hypothetical protein
MTTTRAVIEAGGDERGVTSARLHDTSSCQYTGDGARRYQTWSLIQKVDGGQGGALGMGKESRARSEAWPGVAHCARKHERSLRQYTNSRAQV